MNKIDLHFKNLIWIYTYVGLLNSLLSSYIKHNAIIQQFNGRKPNGIGFSIFFQCSYIGRKPNGLDFMCFSFNVQTIDRLKQSCSKGFLLIGLKACCWCFLKGLRGRALGVCSVRISGQDRNNWRGRGAVAPSVFVWSVKPIPTRG